MPKNQPESTDKRILVLYEEPRVRSVEPRRGLPDEGVSSIDSESVTPYFSDEINRSSPTGLFDGLVMPPVPRECDDNHNF